MALSHDPDATRRADGVVAGIFVTARSAAPMQSLAEVTAIQGRGLEGDRYFMRSGTFSREAAPRRQVTLIEIEAVEAAQRDYGLALEGADTRRNILTRGVALNHLVGKEFDIGDATLRGLKLCEPCSHLGRLTTKSVVKALIHRGGLNAEVLKGGKIRVGDPIV